MIQQLHFWIYAQRIDIRVIIYIPMFREALVTIAKTLNKPKCLSTINRALADVAQWIEHRPMNQRVPGSIPSQGTCLGCRPGPW